MFGCISNIHVQHTWSVTTCQKGWRLVRDHDDLQTTRVNRQKKCNKYSSFQNSVPTNIRIGVEDNAWLPSCCELTKSDGSLRSVTNRHQFGGLLRIWRIGQPSFQNTVKRWDFEVCGDEVKYCWCVWYICMYVYKVKTTSKERTWRKIKEVSKHCSYDHEFLVKAWWIFLTCVCSRCNNSRALLSCNVHRPIMVL